MAAVSPQESASILRPQVEEFEVVIRGDCDHEGLKRI
jgi:hypothetical protein